LAVDQSIANDAGRAVVGHQDVNYHGDPIHRVGGVDFVGVGRNGVAITGIATGDVLVELAANGEVWRATAVVRGVENLGAGELSGAIKQNSIDAKGRDAQVVLGLRNLGKKEH